MIDRNFLISMSAIDEGNIMKLVANHDGQVIISVSDSSTCIWYTFQLETQDKDICALEHIIRQIQSGKATPMSHNGEYKNYLFDDIYVSVTPAWNRSRRSKPDYIMHSETIDMYDKFVKPMVQCPNWIRRIDDGNANGEVILTETNDYYLLPDFKWDRKVKNMYLLLIFKDPQLGSIRDLEGRHLPLLERVYREVIKFVLDNYGLPSSKIRCFFHYMPSAWRLHLHIQHVSANAALGAGTQCARARTIGDVMNNIRLMPDYYQKATLECIVNRDRYNEFYGCGRSKKNSESASGHEPEPEPEPAESS
jgi:hypothetical protein